MLSNHQQNDMEVYNADTVAALELYIKDLNQKINDANNEKQSELQAKKNNIESKISVIREFNNELLNNPHDLVKESILRIHTQINGFLRENTNANDNHLLSNLFLDKIHIFGYQDTDDVELYSFLIEDGVRIGQIKYAMLAGYMQFLYEKSLQDNHSQACKLLLKNLVNSLHIGLNNDLPKPIKGLNQSCLDIFKNFALHYPPNTFHLTSNEIIAIKKKRYSNALEQLDKVIHSHRSCANELQLFRDSIEQEKNRSKNFNFNFYANAINLAVISMGGSEGFYYDSSDQNKALNRLISHIPKMYGAASQPLKIAGSILLVIGIGLAVASAALFPPISPLAAALGGVMLTQAATIIAGAAFLVGLIGAGIGIAALSASAEYGVAKRGRHFATFRMFHSPGITIQPQSGIADSTPVSRFIR